MKDYLNFLFKKLPDSIVLYQNNAPKKPLRKVLHGILSIKRFIERSLPPYQVVISVLL